MPNLHYNNHYDSGIHKAVPVNRFARPVPLQQRPVINNEREPAERPNNRLDLLCSGMAAISALAFVCGAAGVIYNSDPHRNASTHNTITGIDASIGAFVTGSVGCLSALCYAYKRIDDLERGQMRGQVLENGNPQRGRGGVGRE